MTSCAAVSRCLRGGPSMTCLMYLQRMRLAIQATSESSASRCCASDLWAACRAPCRRKGLMSLQLVSVKDEGLAADCHL